jgi:hypothetical protein
MDVKRISIPKQSLIILNLETNIVFVFNDLPPTSVQNKCDLPGPLPNFDSATTVTL